MKQLSFWTFAVGIKIIPCIALTFLSCYLIKAILSAQKRRKQLKANGNQNDRTTGMLVSVVILFIITELPQGILALLGAILDESFLKNCYGKLGDLMDIVALVNSAVNFVLYCCMTASKFRVIYSALTLPTPQPQLINHQVIHTLKVAQSKAIPTRRAKIGTEIPMCSESTELQSAKRHAKLWLKIWITCGRPQRRTVFELKRSTKHKHKTEMKSIVNSDKMDTISGTPNKATRNDGSLLDNSAKEIGDNTFSQPEEAKKLKIEVLKDL
ncbi:hypothetical protein QYM36_014304 [Artemia franciscana]|uniref:G-protein coupled receptors family 1 profile domain-containing protein n=1 Tax=Artemia franciscana TaxID=6661 RepID=A0AA88HKD2_ARTSF|nr:hypothetical protein QYM36_014304 [Artemia franciscana]